MLLHTDLQWIVKIPDLENVIMYACNAIDQPDALQRKHFRPNLANILR